jgi:hypothetical protein
LQIVGYDYERNLGVIQKYTKAKINKTIEERAKKDR